VSYPDEPPPRPHLRDRLLSLSALGKLPPIEPLIDGLVYRRTLAQLSGSAGSYKSFVALGWACTVALAGGRVVYVAPEGAEGLYVRTHAWCQFHGVDPAAIDERVRVLPAPIQLGNVIDVGEAIDVMRDTAGTLLVLDTRARCTLGMEENSATEQGRAIAAVEAMIAGTDGSVLALHHSGRQGDNGRGSSAWDGAVWSDLRIGRTAGATLRATVTCAKHKDVPDGCTHPFTLVPMVVDEATMPGRSVRDRSTLVSVQGGDLSSRLSSSIVQDAVKINAGHSGLSRSEIVKLAEARKVSRSSAYDAVNRLASEGVLINVARKSAKRPRYVIDVRQGGLIP
jgi:hypothetical protein